MRVGFGKSGSGLGGVWGVPEIDFRRLATMETSPCPSHFSCRPTSQLQDGTNNVEPSAGETKRTGG